jgi:DNA-binding NtrC family response regulator
MKSIFFITSNQDQYKTIRKILNSAYKIDHGQRLEQALDLLKEKRYDIILVAIEALRSETNNGYTDTLHLFWDIYPSVEIIVVAPQETIRDAVIAVKAGASDYLIFPFNPEEVKHTIESLHESLIVQSELDYLRDKFWKSDTLELVQTRSPQMKLVFDKVRSVAPTKSTVLIIGETGTGKGVLAKLIHRHSRRMNEKFISLHCGAIPDNLIESELFGHEKGAFTGAIRRKLGKFEIAKGGTIFLDEIGTISPASQIKILQVLQDGIFERVGGEENISSNVRIIAATNMDLKTMCDEGTFRKDLYYRLNVFPIEIPTLTERREDIPYLAEIFLKKMNKFHQKNIHGIHPRILEAFNKYTWPGNIRELENLMERAYILETTHMLTPESFPGELFDADEASTHLKVSTSFTLEEVRRKAIENVERLYLKEILSQKSGKIKDTAEVAGISPRQLNKLMKKHGLRKEAFK